MRHVCHRWQLGAAERIGEAEALKAKGTALFKAGSFEEALELYVDAVRGPYLAIPRHTSPYLLTPPHISLQADYLRGVELGGDFKPSDVSDAEAAAASAALLSCLLNGATCCNKLGRSAEAVTHCTDALKMDGDSVKALFRRGVARTSLGEYEAAKADLKQA